MLAAPPSPNVTVGTAEGATTTVASAADTGMNVASVRGPSDGVNAGGDATMAAGVAADESAVTADDAADGAVAVEPSGGSRKRRRARPHTQRGLHSGRSYTTGVLRPVRARERTMVRMADDVIPNGSAARAWSGEVRAGQMTQWPWRRKPYAPNVAFIPAPQPRSSLGWTL